MMRYLLLVLLLKTVTWTHFLVPPFYAPLVQNELLKTFTPGHVASLRCVLSPGPENYLFWFKHTSGHAPVCIVSYYPSTNQEDFILTISNATPSDAGWYYCGFRHSDLIAFSHGVYLSEERELKCIIHLVALTTSNILCFIIAVSLFCTRRRNKPPLSGEPQSAFTPHLHT
uniref:Ig-like domain-containing protein n=1 Tax=Denticeps clupeoides TaxID=299321 RepID=A0AAY4D9J0_9TELE